MISVSGLVKEFGGFRAVNQLSFEVPTGEILGFLGPNGAGKSTTMRMMLGIEGPTSGSVTVNGRPYREHAAPLREAGALLDARAVHPARSAYHHLLALAQTAGIGRKRVDEIVEAVGLREVARQPAKRFSLGMGQRLGIATALLGDPRTVVLDEPLNGLDTEGIRWVRGLLRSLADEGRTVFVSSHLMSEMALTAERLVVIGRGRLIADTGTAEFIASAARNVVRVRTTEPTRLAELLAAPDVEVTRDQDGALCVSGLSTDQVGLAAAGAGVPLLELTPQQASLEEAFMDLTKDAVDYSAGGAR